MTGWCSQRRDGQAKQEMEVVLVILKLVEPSPAFGAVTHEVIEAFADIADAKF